nr:unnamed protein product [Callosobruchus analis]
MCLQETHLKTNEYKHPPKNYNGVVKMRINQERASGGVSIFTRSNIQAKEIPLVTTLEAIAVNITHQTK